VLFRSGDRKRKKRSITTYYIYRTNHYAKKTPIGKLLIMLRIVVYIGLTIWKGENLSSESCQALKSTIVAFCLILRKVQRVLISMNSQHLLIMGLYLKPVRSLFALYSTFYTFFPTIFDSITFIPGEFQLTFVLSALLFLSNVNTGVFCTLILRSNLIGGVSVITIFAQIFRSCMLIVLSTCFFLPFSVSVVLRLQTFIEIMYVILKDEICETIYKIQFRELCY